MKNLLVNLDWQVTFTAVIRVVTQRRIVTRNLNNKRDFTRVNCSAISIWKHQQLYVLNRKS